MSGNPKTYLRHGLTPEELICAENTTDDEFYARYAPQKLRSQDFSDKDKARQGGGSKSRPSGIQADCRNACKEPLGDEKA